MPDRVLNELSTAYGLTVGQLQRLQILDGTLVEDVTLPAGTATLVPHGLGRAYRGFFIVKGHSGGAGSSSSSSTTTTFGTLYRWDGTQVTDFTYEYGSGASLSVDTWPGDGRTPAIKITLPASLTSGELHLWSVTDLILPTRYWAHMNINEQDGSTSQKAGHVFSMLDYQHFVAWMKYSSAGTSAFYKANNGAPVVRSATYTVGVEDTGANYDSSYMMITVDSIAPTASLDPTVRGHIGGPMYQPGSGSDMFTWASWGSAGYDSSWRTTSPLKYGFGVYATGAVATSTAIYISSLYVATDPASTDTSETYTSAVASTTSSGVTEDTTSTDFDRTKFMRLTAASDQTVNLWVF